MTTTTVTKTDAVEKTTKLKLSLNETEKLTTVYPKYKFHKWEFETPVIWTSVFFITVWHVIAVYYAFITLPYLGKPGLVIYNFIIGGIGGFGITAGVHRYFTHRSFKAKLPLRIILLICYSVAGQNSVKDWVRDHRVHHKFSETDADPHNAKRGFFFSHVGWLMMKKHPEVTRRGRTVDIEDLFEDPLVAFHQKYFFWFKLMFCFVIPTIIPPLLLEETWYHSIMTVCFVRYIVSLNSTWAVNSAAHLWGTKPYDKVHEVTCYHLEIIKLIVFLQKENLLQRELGSFPVRHGGRLSQLPPHISLGLQNG
ncbi:hypothetical protein JTB14_018645 [Gonioctena quinquepunctata]|nr:hypothetical protein JTB14_018645 [Gonioctena quinquepunctata]